LVWSEAKKDDPKGSVIRTENALSVEAHPSFSSITRDQILNFLEKILTKPLRSVPLNFGVK